MDLFLYILLLLIGGCFAGFMAGLLGIGGGIIITPIQYYLFTSTGCSPKTALTMTFATGLAVIGVTMINSSRKHRDNNLIVPQHLKSMMILGFIATVTGAVTAMYVDVLILKYIFGIVCIVSTAVLALVKSQITLDNIKTDALSFNLTALFAGFFSGLIGPAAAALVIPVFVVYFKYPVVYTVATTSLLSVVMSLGGVICYIILGLNAGNLPEFSLGYVNLLQFVFLSLTSIPVSGFSANLSKRINPKWLKILQVTVISYIGLQMTGVFEMFLSIF